MPVVFVVFAALRLQCQPGQVVVVASVALGCAVAVANWSGWFSGYCTGCAPVVAVVRLLSQAVTPMLLLWLVCVVRPLCRLAFSGCLLLL
jgi:hypothetical protein